MKSKLLATLIAAACGALIAAPAAAEQLTGQMTVSMNVTGTCTSLSVGSMNFGSAASGGSIPAADGQATITVNCTTGTPFTLDADMGSFGTSMRSMQPSGNPMAQGIGYDLFTNSDRTTVWGTMANGGSGSLISLSADGGSQAVTVYGRTLGTSSLTPGSYTDFVTVTLSF